MIIKKHISSPKECPKDFLDKAQTLDDTVHALLK